MDKLKQICIVLFKLGVVVLIGFIATILLMMGVGRFLINYMNGALLN